MTDQLCCAKCKQPLKVVCDAHGTEFVPDRVTTLPPLKKDRPLKLRNIPQVRPSTRASRVPKPDTTVARILAALSAEPSTVAAVARSIQHDAKLTGIQLSILASRGRVVRVGRGLYAKAPT